MRHAKVVHKEAIVDRRVFEIGVLLEFRDRFSLQGFPGRGEGQMLVVVREIDTPFTGHEASNGSALGGCADEVELDLVDFWGWWAENGHEGVDLIGF